MIQLKILTLQYCLHQNSTPCLSEGIENYPYTIPYHAKGSKTEK